MVLEYGPKIFPFFLFPYKMPSPLHTLLALTGSFISNLACGGLVYRLYRLITLILFADVYTTYPWAGDAFFHRTEIFPFFAALAMIDGRARTFTLAKLPLRELLYFVSSATALIL